MYTHRNGSILQVPNKRYEPDDAVEDVLYDEMGLGDNDEESDVGPAKLKQTIPDLTRSGKLHYQQSNFYPYETHLHFCDICNFF